MVVIDADAHVEESEATFAAPWFDEALAARRPRVIPAGDRASWVIDDRVFPKLSGKGITFFSTPPAYDGVPTRATRTKPESMESTTLSDPAARVAQMAAEGLDLQVIYPTLFLAYPLTDDAALGNALARCYNSWMSDICARVPDKLKWTCVVNLDDVAGAADELRRARRELGAVGVMIMGTAGERKLDDPALDPFYAAAAETDCPIAVHVGWPMPSLTNAYDSIYDSLVLPFAFSMFTGFVDIIAGGVLDRHPSLRVAFLEAGCEWIPFLLDRMHHYYEHAHRRKLSQYAATRPPLEYVLGGNVFLSCEVDDRLLPYCLEQYGAERFLFASDIPHGDREPNAVATLRARTDVSEAAKAKILGENALRFYKL